MSRNHHPLTLFVVRCDEDSQKAIELVKETTIKDEFDICFCSPAMAEEYIIPFISDEDQSPWLGIKEIRYFFDKKGLLTTK